MPDNRRYNALKSIERSIDLSKNCLQNILVDVRKISTENLFFLNSHFNGFGGYLPATQDALDRTRFDLWDNSIEFPNSFYAARNFICGSAADSFLSNLRDEDIDWVHIGLDNHKIIGIYIMAVNFLSEIDDKIQYIVQNFEEYPPKTKDIVSQFRHKFLRDDDLPFLQDSFPSSAENNSSRFPGADPSVTVARREASEGIRQIMGLIPDQIPDAVEFEICNERVAVAHRPNTPKSNAEAIAKGMRQGLLTLGEDLLADLHKSDNAVSMRLCKKFERIHAALDRDEDAILLDTLIGGLAGIRDEYGEMLGNDVCADLDHYVEKLRLYVAQFQEWHAMLSNLAEAKLVLQDAKAVAALASEVLGRVRAMPQVVANEVPYVIEQLRDAAEHTTDPVDRAKVQYNVLESFGNFTAKLMAIASGLGKKFVEKLPEKAADEVAKEALKAIWDFVKHVAANPLMALLKDTKWIEPALNAFGQVMEWLTTIW